MRNPANRMAAGIPSHRCAACRLPRPACLCDLIPRVETRTRIVLILHQLEDCKTSNTGRLALRCLPNGEIVIRGDGRRIRGAESRDDADLSALSPVAAAAPRDWSAHGDPVLLFPHPDARPLEAWRDHPRPVTLIVPDGTWRQGKRVRHRTPGLADVPCASLARSTPSTYRLRTTPDPKRLATLEAIAEALGILEGEQPREELLRIFDVMVERSLRARTGRI